MNAIIDTVSLILSLCLWTVFIHVAIDWLISFGIVNSGHHLVMRVRALTSALLNPILRPLRRIIPPVAGFDLSTLALIIVVYFLSRFIPEILRGLL